MELQIHEPTTSRKWRRKPNHQILSIPNSPTEGQKSQRPNVDKSAHGAGNHSTVKRDEGKASSHQSSLPDIRIT